jgi:hypothetical protein
MRHIKIQTHQGSELSKCHLYGLQYNMDYLTSARFAVATEVSVPPAIPNAGRNGE